MKTIFQALFAFSLGIILFGCDNNDNTFDFSIKSLKQTRWTGTFEDSIVEGPELATRTFDAGIIFTSEENRDCSLDANVEPFKYTVKENVLSIQSNSLFNGNWLLVNQSKNRMILEKGTGGEGAHKVILTLTKTH